MILFKKFMEKEKLVAIGLAVIIIALASLVLFITYGGDIIDNLFSEGTEIETGDCVDVNYIGRYASNNTVFDSSYEDYETKSGATPLQIFVTLDPESYPPDGYENYTSGWIEGFIEGLVGLKEGQTTTIGPIPPEKAYGLYPSVGDKIDISDESLASDMHLEFLDVQKDAAMPEEYIGVLPGNTTTLFILKDLSYSLNQKLTLYETWKNSTTITKINDTQIWLRTTPPDDKMTNFTWVELDPYGSEVNYWENKSTVTTLNESKIIVTHTPDIGETLLMSSGYTDIEYTVVNMTDDKINMSYTGYDGNITYMEIDRTETIERNQTQNITYFWPYEMMDYVISILTQIDPDFKYSLHPLAGESLLFEVTIEEVQKTSDN